jgi:hypothetical protein
MRLVLRTQAIRLARLLVLPAVSLMALVPATGRSTPATAPLAAPALQSAPTDPTAGLLPEVRLRKLHLVRPDLIPYPIAYEIYC